MKSRRSFLFICHLTIFFFEFQPDGGISMLSIDVLEKGGDVPLPIWQMRNQHFGMWDEAQVRIGEVGTAFKVYVTAERGDNSGSTDQSYLSQVL